MDEGPSTNEDAEPTTNEVEESSTNSDDEGQESWAKEGKRLDPKLLVKFIKKEMYNLIRLVPGTNNRRRTALRQHRRHVPQAGRRAG
jgi:hypothetical protein